MKDSTTHIIQVIGANAAALGVTFSHINELLTSISLTLATAYTIYKFIKEINTKNNG